jgi:pimeloyl-ACP methyl ester carboxylesterase
VYAERDPMVPPIVGDRLRALVPAAKFIRLAEASHFAHVDAAQRFVAAIEPFLAGH